MKNQTNRQIISKLLCMLDCERAFAQMRDGRASELTELMYELDQRFLDGRRWRESEGIDWKKMAATICYGRTQH